MMTTPTTSTTSTMIKTETEPEKYMQMVDLRMQLIQDTETEEIPYKSTAYIEKTLIMTITMLKFIIAL